MNSSSDARNPVEHLAEQFLDRKRRGEQPTLREYLERHPDLAADIQDLFPALLMMEDLGESSGGTTGSLAAENGAAVGIRLQRLGDYRILREIGRGGMGVVYEAEQESLGRRVALKVLSAGSLLDPKQVRRFEREAKAAAKLHHTNIVPVFGVGRQDGYHYFVMQFIAGLGLDVVLDDLRRLRQAKSGATPAAKPVPAPASSRVAGLAGVDVARSLMTGRFAAAGPPGDGSLTEAFDGADPAGSPTPTTASMADSGSSSVILPGSSGLSASSDPDRQFYRSIARIGIQVAEALEYANRQGILHRDIKPSNLLLDNRGNVWVADFGLAKTAEADDLTHTGDILGTIRYMAPERFSGHCDARSDVYSLGLTLYELVALRPAYEASDRHTLMDRVLHEEPERLRKVAPGVPRDMETIIAKAAARDPLGRYAAAAALAEDLRRFVEDRPIRARRVSPVERVARWCRRNQILAASISVAAIALVAVAAMSLVYARRQTRYATEKTAANRRIALLAGDLQASLSQSNGLATDLKTSLAVSERRRVALTYERARTNFERGQSACERGEIGPGLLYFIESWRSASEARDPGLAHAARASLSAWRHQAPKLLRQFPSSDVGRISHVAVRPDGKAFAMAGTDNIVRLRNPATGDPIGSSMPHRVAIYGMTFSPDSKTLLTACSDKTTRMWDAAIGSPIGSPLALQWTVHSVAYGPDGKTVLGRSYDETGQMTARLWDAATGSLIVAPLTHQGIVYSVAYSPDGKTVLTGSADRTARLWDAATGAPIGAPLTHQGIVYSVAYSPDGKTVLTGSADQTARLWDAATGSPIGAPLMHQGPVYHALHSPDGKSVLTGSTDQTARLWDAATGTPIGAPSLHQGRAGAIAYSPDVKAVLTVTADGTPRVWDAAAGGPLLGRPVSHRANIQSVAFRPDGKAVVIGGSDGSARIWDTVTASPIGVHLTHRGAVNAVAFSPDGRIVLTGSSDRTARLWDAATGAAIGKPLTHSGEVFAVAYSQDHKTVITGSSDGSARIWDAATGNSIGVPLTLGAHVHVVALSPDGRIVAGAGDGPTARLWDAATGAAIGSLMRPRAFLLAMAFSPDGKTLLTAGSSGLDVWDAATGGLIGSRIKLVTHVVSAAFSSDGQRVLIGGDEASARLRDAITGQQLGPPLPHQGRVTSMALSPDGRTAVTSTGNSEALLWDVAELPDDLPRIECWVHVRTGLAFDEEGQIKNLEDAAWREQRDRITSLGGVPKEAEPRWRLDPILFGPDPTARARAWVERKQWALAEAAFTEAVNARPLDGAVRLERARFYTSRSQPGRAEDDYVRSYTLGSRDPKLIDTIVASDSLFRRVVAEPGGSDATLWAKHGEIRLSQSRWNDAAAAFARELELSPEGRSWESPRSARLLSLARWHRAYARLMELRPDDGQLWCVRGRYYALRDRWELAAADFARGVTSAPPDSEEWFEHACLRLIVGDDEGYRTFVQEIRRREGQTSSPFVAYILARTCTLAAEPVVEPEQVIGWAETPLRYGRPPWNLHVAGAAHYRAGHFAQAIKWLEESNAAFSAYTSGDHFQLQNRFVLAMAQKRSGRAAQARAMLAEAQRLWQRIEAARTAAAVSLPTVDWLPMHILRREAESVILYDPVFPSDPFAH
jgi:eukaryotic-like serine/threonine-protein kinase